jgi:hypothetical protein
MTWHGEPGQDGYAYSYGAAAAPCGCASYGYPVMWVPVPIRTHYVYSEPVRHVEEVVDEKWVDKEVVETKTVPVRRETKYVKSAPAKVTKGKVVRSTK